MGFDITFAYFKVSVKVKGWVKVKGRGQGNAQGQRSKSNFWATAVGIRGSAAKSKESSHYQSEVCVCVSSNCADAVDQLLISIYTYV